MLLIGPYKYVPNTASKYFFDNFHLTTPYFCEKIQVCDFISPAMCLNMQV